MRANTLIRIAAVVMLASLAGCAVQPLSAVATSDPASMPLALDCQQVTGSRIRSRSRTECAPVGYPFRSISAQELESTGEMDLNRALRQVAPVFH